MSSGPERTHEMNLKEIVAEMLDDCLETEEGRMIKGGIMKVWTLMCQPTGYRNKGLYMVIGVFSSEEKAKEAFKALPEDEKQWYDISAWELDTIPDLVEWVDLG